ncbi:MULTISPECIES: acetyl-CoA hydrolase/transferase C-terminal domain-containing protein [Metallosphaera]|uniref:acetyl-CoA hydrolase/transferase C-terminal domain-containing protein n=1 Tax=Metallosphaera TaxID=41980 RepID=UPI001F0702FA|nr:acetyl-CoA hydrolase/transferase C-terminal domain-containing protein [Metallosphaera sedula]MCH1770413.1 hypothetical protein [Metallosphaera sedula]MCP6727753.1 hypothetical protein [Metallosphaera sedula]
MERIACREMRSLVTDPMDAVKRHLPRHGIIAFGGMSGSSVPKEFPRAMAQHLEGEKGYALTLFTGGATSEEFERNISRIGHAFRRRYPFLSGGSHRELVNKNELEFFDYGLHKFNRKIRSGELGPIDLAVIEATAILEDCSVIPSLSLDSSISFIGVAKKVILEVNESKPELEGLHDIYLGDDVSIGRVYQRIGDTRLTIPPSRIGAILVTREEDGSPGAYKSPGDVEARISENIMEFMMNEIREGFSRELYERGDFVIQPGAGSLSSKLADVFPQSGLTLSIWAETLPAKWALIPEDNVKFISSSALFTLRGEENFLRKFLEARDFRRVVLRGQNVTNNPEVIQRLNLVSILQAIDLDIYGNANISHIHGKIYNGVGGSVDFAPNAYITVIALPSVTGDGMTSRIVPLTTHVDVPEHYVDVVVTEQGYADLRGKSPHERAEEIINKCAHPRFRDSLLQYYGKVREMGHEAHDLRLAHELFGL